MTTRSGVVLAGGYATRFGDADKTLASLDGKPLLAHAVDNIAPAVDRVVVSCREEQISAFEAALDASVSFCPDPTPDQGPLAGLAATLAAVETSTLALATADMPCVPSALYDQFFDALGDTDAVAVDSEGYLQPAPAVYRTDPLRESVDARRAEGDARLRSLFQTLSVERVAADSVRSEWGANVLDDVNTREALDRLDASLSSN